MQVTVGELRKNLKEILQKLPVELVDGKRKVPIAMIVPHGGYELPTPTKQEMQKHENNIKQVSGNKAFQDFMAKNTMIKSDEVVNKATGRQCELPICKRDAVGQGIWVEYDMDIGERVTTLWLCQEHLEKGRKNAAHV